MSVGRKAANHAGEFGPEAYTTWRSSSLGTITEDIERRLILHLAGELNGRAVLDVGCGDGARTLVCWQNGASPLVGCDIDRDHRMWRSWSRSVTPSLRDNRLRLLSCIRATLNRVADFSQIEG
jgi:hypothetical protein